MPERRFDDGYWDDPFVQSLSKDGKLLYVYLWTNKHCNPAGLYQVTPSTIAFETKLAEADIPRLFEELAPKVVWYRGENLVWVKNFIKRQSISSKFLVVVARCLTSINNHAAVEDLINYNEERYGLLIPCQPQHISLTKRECVLIRDNFTCQYCGKEITTPADYEMDHIIPIRLGGKDHYPNLAASCRSCNQKKLDKMPDEVGLPQPNPRSFHASQATYLLKNNGTLRAKWLLAFPNRKSEVDLILNNIDQHYSTLKWVEKLSSTSTSIYSLSSSIKGVTVVKGKGELSEDEQTIIKCLGNLFGWRLTNDDIDWLREFRGEFPDFKIPELKACIDYHSGRTPAKHKGIWKNRFRNWMIKAREIRSRNNAANGRPQSTRQPTQRRRPITYIPGADEVEPED